MMHYYLHILFQLHHTLIEGNEAILKERLQYTKFLFSQIQSKFTDFFVVLPVSRIFQRNTKFETSDRQEYKQSRIIY